MRQSLGQPASPPRGCPVSLLSSFGAPLRGRMFLFWAGDAGGGGGMRGRTLDGLRSQLPGFPSQLCRRPAVQLGAGFLTSLSLDSLIDKGEKRAPAGIVMLLRGLSKLADHRAWHDACRSVGARSMVAGGVVVGHPPVY